MNPVVQSIRNHLAAPDLHITGAESLFDLGFAKSIELLKLQSLISQSLKSSCPPISANMKVKELLAILGFAPLAEQSLAEEKCFSNQFTTDFNADISTKIDTFTGIETGVDMEAVENLPESKNYKTHSFYKEIFNEYELNFCLLRQDPRKSLCGIFCAKEAVRKCFFNLSNLAMKEVVIYHDSFGKPLVVLENKKLRHIYDIKVSISYCAQFAIAHAITMRRDS